MEKRQFRIGLIFLTLFTALSSAVYAQSDPFDFLFKSIEKIGGLYETYYYAIDCIMYAVILIGAAQFALHKQFEGRGGKAVIIGMGVSLAIAAAYFERNTGFKLIAGLGPAAVIIMLLLFWILAYKLFVGMGHGGRLVAMAIFSLSIFYTKAQFPQVRAWAMSTTGWIAGAWNLIEAAAILSFFWLAIELVVKLVQATGIGGAVAGAAGWGRTPPGTPPPTPQGAPPAPGPAPPPAPGTPPPNPPPNPPRIYVADQRIILEWDHPTGGARTGYRVIRTPAGGGPVGFNLGPNQRIFVDGPLPPGVNHAYTVEAENGAGNFSAPVQATNPITGSNVGTPTAPTCNVNIGAPVNAPGGNTSMPIMLSRALTGNHFGGSIGSNFMVYLVNNAFDQLVPAVVAIPAPPAAGWLFLNVGGANPDIIAYGHTIPAAQWAATFNSLAPSFALVNTHAI